MKFCLAWLLTLAVLIQALPAADQPAAPVKCPACSAPMSSVPMLLGLPNKEMIRQVELGRALLGGCIGDPAHPEQALVCRKCRKWKTEPMKYWQDLPKPFGTVEEKTGK